MATSLMLGFFTDCVLYSHESKLSTVTTFPLFLVPKLRLGMPASQALLDDSAKYPMNDELIHSVFITSHFQML